MSLRRRLTLSLVTILILFAINVGTHFWGSFARNESMIAYRPVDGQRANIHAVIAELGIIGEARQACKGWCDLPEQYAPIIVDRPLIVLQHNPVVHTARRTGPSVAYGGDHRIVFFRDLINELWSGDF